MMAGNENSTHNIRLGDEAYSILKGWTFEGETYSRAIERIAAERNETPEPREGGRA